MAYVYLMELGCQVPGGASGGSCGGLIIFLRHYVGAGGQIGCGPTAGVKIPNGNKMPGDTKNTCLV